VTILGRLAPNQRHITGLLFFADFNDHVSSFNAGVGFDKKREPGEFEIRLV
jgi:hypothetical protein